MQENYYQHLLPEATLVVESSTTGRTMWTHALVEGSEDFVTSAIETAFEELDDVPLKYLTTEHVDKVVNGLLNLVESTGVRKWLLKARKVSGTFVRLQVSLGVKSAPRQIELARAFYVKSRTLGKGLKLLPWEEDLFNIQVDAEPTIASYHPLIANYEKARDAVFELIDADKIKDDSDLENMLNDHANVWSVHDPTFIIDIAALKAASEANGQ